MSNKNQPHQATKDNSRVAIVQPKRQEEDEAKLKWRRLELEVEVEVAALKLQGLEEEAATFEFSVASAHCQTTINLSEVITDNRRKSTINISSKKSNMTTINNVS